MAGDLGNEPAPEVQGQEGADGNEPVVDAGVVAPEVQGKEQEPEHPEFDKRIGELRGQIGHLTRKGQNDSQMIESLVQHNKEMDELYGKRMDSVEDQVSQSAAPDYEEDPKGYLDWKTEQQYNKLEKLMKVAPVAPNSQPHPGSQVHPQELVQRGIHNDYDEIIKEVNDVLKVDAYGNIKNPIAAQTIFSAPDAFKAAYEYGVKNRQIEAQRRTGQLDQGYTEGSSPAPNRSSTGLTQADKQMAEQLGISEEKMLARKNKIAARRA